MLIFKSNTIVFIYSIFYFGFEKELAQNPLYLRKIASPTYLSEVKLTIRLSFSSMVRVTVVMPLIIIEMPNV